MKTTPPKVITFWIAVILAVLGVLGHLTKIPVVTPAYAFWFVVAGFVVLALGVMVEDM